MRLVIQRVQRAKVTVENRVTGEIGPGLLVLLGVHKDDTDEDLSFCINKLVNLRIFADEGGAMNRSLLETGGGLLIVSQFTLYGNTRKGRRPSFDAAAPPAMGRELYERFVAQARAVEGIGEVETGEFGAMMAVELVNDGPVTLIVDSHQSRKHKLEVD